MRTSHRFEVLTTTPRRPWILRNLRARLATVALAAVLGACSAGAQSSDTPAPPQAGDSIRAEIRGLIGSAGGNAGDSSLFQITANGIAWELDLAGNARLAESGKRLAGMPAVAIGTYREVGGGRNPRRILTVERLDAAPTSARREYIDVTVHGRVRAGIMAIGAETTGITITAAGVTWELAAADRQRDALEGRAGRTAVVSGELTRRVGVEIPSRFIVTVQRIE